LLNRLIKHQHAVLAFAFHKEVPFTNNLAERHLRPIKTKQKVAGSFRTLEGAQRHARIYSFLLSEKINSIFSKKKNNVFKGKQTIFQ
jgi:transposase